MGLGALGELQMQSRGDGRLHASFLSLHHPPNAAPGLAVLDDDTVDWLKRTTLSI